MEITFIIWFLKADKHSPPRPRFTIIYFNASNWTILRDKSERNNTKEMLSDINPIIIY